MERRGFLKGILALGVAPAIITTPGLLMPLRGIARVDELGLACVPEELTGFGLAEIKTEGGAIAYGSYPTAAALWPGVKAYWDRAYNEHSIFDEKDLSCTFDPETGLYLPK